MGEAHSILKNIILGIDPGTRRTGFGILRVQGDRLEHIDHGVIRLKDSAPLAERLNVLNQELQKLYSQYNVHTTVIERFSGKMPTALLSSDMPAECA